MKKGYYIVGAVLLSVGAYFLYTRIKKGKTIFNTGNEDNFAQTEDGSHLNPPKETSPTIPSLATPTIV